VVCENRDSILQAYFDGELDLIRSLEFEKHLETCADCASQLEQQLAVRQAMRSATLVHHAPPTLINRIQANLPLEPKPQLRLSRPVPAWRWFPLIAAVLLGMFLAAVAVRNIDDRRQNLIAENSLAREIVSSHIRSMQPGHLLDVESTDQHTVKPWFDGKLDFAPSVVDPADAGFPLIGGRLDYLNHHTVAALVYRRQKHLINVFAWPEDSNSPTPSDDQSLQGYNLLCWMRQSMNVCAVSDLNRAELRIFSELLQK
jgi:anti-sigma factor RsiW